MLSKAKEKINIFNVGADEYCEVNDSIGWICEQLGMMPDCSYTGTERGWIGDNPFIFLECTKLRKLGWKPQLTIREGVIRTVDFLQKNSWVLEQRDHADAKSSRISEMANA